MSNAGAQTNFGSCWGGVTDVTTPSVMVTGNTAIAQMLLRRFTTPRGRLLSDPNFGLDLTNYVNTAVTSATLASLAKQCNQEATKDERVRSAAITLTFLTGAITISGTVTTANGPFTFVGVVGVVSGAVTTTLASISPA
jgi:phage baseplate assembly protein W